MGINFQLYAVCALSKSLSTLSQKSATVAEFADCRRCLAIFCDRRTFLRQCGQGLSHEKVRKIPIR